MADISTPFDQYTTDINEVTLRQAYLLGKEAGIKQGRDRCAHCDTPLLHEGEVLEAKLVGIREVVEWIEAQVLIAGHNMTTGQDIGMISKQEWQAKLKEWGL